jgi:hypothetical protein
MVRPIDVCDSSTLVCGDPTEQLFSQAIEDIWAQAGITIDFLSWGAGGRPGERLYGPELPGGLLGPPFPSRWNPVLDKTTSFQRGRGGMNNKIKSISHRSFGFRSAENFIAAIYHGCARLPLPVER